MRLIVELLNLLVRGTALMLGLIGAALALGGWGGAFSQRLDALTHATPLWMAMGVAAVLLGGVFSREGERLVMLALGTIAIIASATLMLPELIAASKFKPQPSKVGDLKVIQFNAWHENTAPDKSLKWLLAQNADVVVVEEAGGPALQVIKGLRDAYPYESCKKGLCEPWIFARRPIVDSGRLAKGLPAAWATVKHPIGDFTVVGAHYTWPVPAGRQQAQSNSLIQSLARFDRQSLILTGDFNATPWSFILRRQDKKLGLQRLTRALPSWPAGQFSRVAVAPAPFLPIDHVYAGSEWRAIKIERGPAIGSDHHPIIVTLRRKPK